MSKIDNASAHHSGDYDKNIRKTIPYYDTFHDETLALVKTVCPDVRVWLDTGCGTGTLVRKALAVFKKTKFMLADPSIGMLAIARKRLGKYSNRQVNFLGACGTECLPKKIKGKIQVISAIQCHHYLDKEQRELATKRCYNLLAKGGIYITFENIRPDGAAAIKNSLDHWAAFQLSQGRDKKTVKQHIQRFNQEYFPITIREHLQLLKKCGFKTSELFWYSRMQAGFYAIK
jgi:tRNA (cmo5U34)-methyltransferase